MNFSVNILEEGTEFCLFVRGGWGNDRGRVTLGRGKTATKKLAEDAIKLIKNVASKKVSLSLFLSTKKKTFEAHTLLWLLVFIVHFCPHIQN